MKEQKHKSNLVARREIKIRRSRFETWVSAMAVGGFEIDGVDRR